MRILSEDVTTPAEQRYLLPLQELEQLLNLDMNIMGANLEAIRAQNSRIIADNKLKEIANDKIKEATYHIQTHCRRIFAKQRYTTRLYLDRADVCNELRLLQTPIEASSVMITDSGGVLLPANNYVVGENTIIPTHQWSSGVLTIVYTGGFDVIPPIVTRVAREVVVAIETIGENGNSNRESIAPLEWEYNKETGEMNDAGRDRAAYERNTSRLSLMTQLHLNWLDPYVKRRI